MRANFQCGLGLLIAVSLMAGGCRQSPVENPLGVKVDAAHVFVPPTVDGWQKSEPRALPEADHGYIVGYDHANGLAVTLYHFTRGQAKIPQDLADAAVQREMENAKSGIRQAVQARRILAACVSIQGSQGKNDFH